MNRKYDKLTALMLLFFLGGVALLGLLPEWAHAHGAVSIDEDKCKLFIGSYSMHFTGYQAKMTDHEDRLDEHIHPTDGADRKEFCHDIPELGYTVVVLDAVDPELREMPLEVRIVHDTGDMGNLEAITVFHLPPKIYPAGTVTIRHTFDKPGKFVGLVRAGSGKGLLVSKFPFSVARAPSPLAKYVPFLAIVLVGLGLYWYSSRRYAAALRKKSLASKRSTSNG